MADDAERADVVLDVTEECGQFDAVASVHVPREGVVGFGAAFVQRAFGELFALGFHAFDHGFEIGRRRYALVLRGSFERGPGAPYQQQGGAGGKTGQGKDATRPCPAVIVGAVSGFGIFHRATHYRSIVRERFLT